MPNMNIIKPMFNDIAHYYDFYNDLLSLFIHRLWKRRLILELKELKITKLLDCATGTGDIARLAYRHGAADTITGIDFSENMILLAKEKALKQKLPIHFTRANLEELPFEDKTFEVSTISFGIRNVENLNRAIKEMERVSRKALLILEFGQPENKIIKKILFTFLRSLVKVASQFARNKAAYQYLVDSSEQFPSGKKFLAILKTQTEFNKIYYKKMMFGFVYLYIAKY